MRALFALLCAGSAFAQVSHVTWTVTGETGGSKALLRAAGKVDPGWHLYSASSPAGIPTSFQIAGAGQVRVFQPAPVKAFDKNFGADTETFEGEVTFLIEAKLNQPTTSLDLKARYQTCNDTQCVPSRWSGTVPLTAGALTMPAGYSEAKPPSPAGATPVTQEQGLGAFLLVAFGFGLASLFTPCVFPMIPITMSYFLNRQSGGRGDGVAQAVVFCLGIIVLFSGLGLLITAVLGPFGVVQLGSNPWVNGFISLLFIAFGLSLLGAFEITIPSSILTRLNKSSDKGGFAGTLLMGLTFSLASFA